MHRPEFGGSGDDGAVTVAFVRPLAPDGQRLRARAGSRCGDSIIAVVIVLCPGGLGLRLAVGVVLGAGRPRGRVALLMTEGRVARRCGRGRADTGAVRFFRVRGAGMRAMTGRRPLTVGVVLRTGRPSSRASLTMAKRGVPMVRSPVLRLSRHPTTHSMTGTPVPWIRIDDWSQNEAATGRERNLN